MQKTFTILSSVLLAALALCSCSSTEDVVNPMQPVLSGLYNSECLFKDKPETASNNDSNTHGWLDGTFEMHLEDSSAKCKFYSLHYSCDFERVNIRIIHQPGILSIVEYPSYDDANCMCDVDASFTIENFPQENFLLKIYRGSTATGEYDVNQPIISVYVDTSKKDFIIPYCDLDYYKNDTAQHLPQ